MSWISDLFAAIGKLFGGGEDTPPVPGPTGARVGIRVREDGGGNKSVQGADVTIAVRGKKVEKRTDAGGWARWENVDEGPRHVYVTKSKFHEFDDHFDVHAPDTTLTVAIIEKRAASEPPKPTPSPSPGAPPLTSDKLTALRRVGQAYLSEYEQAHVGRQAGQHQPKQEAFVRRVAACLHYGAPTLGIRGDGKTMLLGQRGGDVIAQDALIHGDSYHDVIISAGTQGRNLDRLAWPPGKPKGNAKAIQPDKGLVPKASGSGGGGTPSQGSVKKQGHAFADKNGPFVAVGHSVFPAPFFQQKDRGHLNKQLDWLQDRDCDYVRFILELSGKYWKDREQNPLSSGFDRVFADLLDNVYDHGMRSNVVIFGEWEHANTREKRRQVVEMVADVCNTREEKILYVEPGNECGKPGRWNDIGEIRELAALFKSREPNILVSLTSPTSREHATRLYQGSVADVFHFHDQRAAGNEGVAHRDVFKHGDIAGIPGIPDLAASGEPRGPKASAGGDVSDPATLVNDFKSTVNVGVGAYCFHSRAGVGLGSVNWPERNLWDHPTADAAFKGIIKARNAMPKDAANR